MHSWPLDRTPPDYVLGHVRAVLADRVLDDARVVVRDGLIADAGPHPPGAGADLDGRGRYVLPGLVDPHSDVLARECRPRPGAHFPPSFGLASAAARLRSSGVTTAYHGLAYQARSPVGLPIESPSVVDLGAALASQQDPTHRVLHRLDIRCPEGRHLLEAELARQPADAVAVVSHEDHTPGQGQYADPERMVRWLVQGEGFTDDAARAHVHSWRTERERLDSVAADTLDWLGQLARSGQIVLFGHDPATRDDVDGLLTRGARVAEFPTTIEAAQRAHEIGLLVIAGAPNVVRGGSHAGNVSAAELVAAGLVDALASDYLPSALLPAVVQLVKSVGISLPEAVALVTSGPGACVGDPMLAGIHPGARADLLIADLDADEPRMLCVLDSAVAQLA